ncbi:MAG: molybdopterin-dependent oxidoreductase [Desulfobacterales bacterium]|nr:molybdopterin-dependent oxidoreductase [Desulfobacterales bacterium]
MKTQRQFIKFSIEFLSGVGVFSSAIGLWLKKAYAQTKRIIVPRGTDLSSLRNENPATLDTRNLEIIPLKDFETMGLTDHEVDLKSWQLIIEGNIAAPRNLSYSQILELPSIERDVLLICPGVFTNHGRWKGISLMTVLNLARMKADTTHITVSGPVGPYEKTERFPIADMRSNKVFLAYAVNGEKLPQQHGFPLRIVAEDYYGSDWVKYVYKIEAFKVETQS